MLHRAEGEPVKMLDLGWDHWLRNAAPDTKYAWVQLELPAVRLLSLAAMCRRIAKRYSVPGPGLPYAFLFKETAFSADGKVLLGQTEHGLTCATFILAVLKSVGLDLLQLTEWPHRDTDVERHRELLDNLQRDPRVSRAHVEAVNAEVNCVRYRPEEVVGACSSAGLPVSFVYAEAAGEQIIRTFKARTTSSSAAGPSAQATDASKSDESSAD